MNKLSLCLQAFIKLMLVSAVIHLVVLAIYFGLTQDSVPLSFYSIVGLNLFFPYLVTGPFANFYSILTIVIVYCIILFFFNHENRRTR